MLPLPFPSRERNGAVAGGVGHLPARQLELYLRR